MKFVMEQGITYLIKEPKPDDSLKIFATLVKQGSKGFCITRVHPKRIRKRFELGETPILWITTSEVPDEKCVHPSDLAKLNMAINDILKNQENLVILLEGIEYLVTYNGFDSILRFVQVINDRIMVTNSRFIITLDAATLDTGSLHILERDLSPIEELSKLEVSFPEYPQAGVIDNLWRPKLEEKLRSWREQGIVVDSLEAAVAQGQEAAQKAFEQFEAALGRAAAIQNELKSMDTAGFEKEVEAIGSKLLNPATVKEAEDELVALQINMERRKKDDKRRRQDEERLRDEFRGRFKDWTAQGYLTTSLTAVLNEPLEVVRREFEHFEAAIHKMKELKEELLLMDTAGFESEVETIRSRLMAPSRVNEVEDDIFRLKILIERRRKEERRKKEEEDRGRSELQGRLAQWKAEGFLTARLDGWERLPLAQAKATFEAFEKEVGVLKELEGELSMIGPRGLEAQIDRLRAKLRNVELVPEIRADLAELKGRMEKGQKERRREDFQRKTQEWKVLGYNVDRLKQLENADPDTVQKELVVFKIRVHRLKELEGELALLDTSGFGAEVAALQPLFRDVERIAEVEGRLTELRIKIRNRAEEQKRGREDRGRQKRELLEKMSVWLSEGYSVAKLEGLLASEPDLDKLSSEFDHFERDVVRLKELTGRMRTMDVTGFENEASEVKGLLNDLSRVPEAEDAVLALEAKIRLSREESKRQVTEDEKRKKKAQEKILAWKAQGLSVVGLEKALEEGLEAFKKELSQFSLKLEKLRGIREELAILDTRGLEAEAGALQAKLSDVDNAEEAEAALRSLRARVEERKERERQGKESENEERNACVRKLLEWSAQGLVVERLEKAIDQPMEILRPEFERFERAMRRFEEIRRALESSEYKLFVDEDLALRARLNNPGNLEAVERDFAALKAKVEGRRREQEESEQKRAGIRQRVQKMKGLPLDVSRIEKLLDGDISTLEREFDRFLEDVKLLRALRKRLAALDTRGFEGKAAHLEEWFTDPDKASELEEGIDGLAWEIDRQRKAEQERRGELLAKVDGWERGGLNVAPLREAAKGDLAHFEEAAEGFERNLEDYRRGLEKLRDFERAYLIKPEAVAERAEPTEAERREEREVEAAGREGTLLAERAVEAEAAQITEVVPHRRAPEDRIRMEQRLRSEHRAQMRRLSERKRKRRRNLILAAAAAAAVTAILVLYAVSAFILPNLKAQGLTIDGSFSDWEGIERQKHPSDPTLPPSINILETAAVSSGGAVFCYVRTEGTIFKGTLNSTTKFYEPDRLGIYFDSDSRLSTGYQIEGIGADLMVQVSGWNNMAQEMFYMNYTGDPRAPWAIIKMDISMKANGDEVELKVLPGEFDRGLAALPTDLVVFELRDSSGNTDTVS